MNDEFYIGWEGSTAPGIGRFVRAVVALLFLVAIGLALAFAAAQHLSLIHIFSGRAEIFY